MYVLFRVDSSSEIGLGHMMRCLALAEQLVLKGAQVFFVCCSHAGSAHHLVIDNGYKAFILPGKEIATKTIIHKSWILYSEEQDANYVLSIIKELNIDVVVVDHYSLSASWERMISPFTKKLVVIDDLANRRHDCDILIDQSMVNDKEDYKSLVLREFDFIGGDNVILRSEFMHAKSWDVERKGSVCISMGGSDPFYITGSVLNIVCNFFEKNQVDKGVKVIIGSACDDDLESALYGIAYSTSVHVNILRSPSRISDILLESEFSILSCGTMVLESCSLGVPTIGISIVDDQISTAKYLAKRKAILHLEAGDIEMFLNKFLEILISCENKRASLSANALSTVDRFGSVNIARKVLSY
ncbi:UDP-2,4-diacetamido-2,4,6-trideoxy-beta-L-altropyranose hydrolase [Halomonas sp. BC04]|uniref:UDP-2,4-diacetamido-2,4, 6-trideoxy-beta-L-altropyranose hydrolase n=1 Tax=Halomonas sp. BC04 TaxID=1403540 RepID=UPI0009E031A8|nr:UDP-2,4-diacetamido-2,4,6-trideoxy-beta-L-altropyranose hydrolase [Halomonas sp. BC04]